MLVHELAFERGTVLQDGDRGDVGEGLSGVDVGLFIRPGSLWNRLRAPMTVPRRRMGRACDRMEAGFDRLGREPGPAAVDRGKVLVHHGLARAVAVEARALVGLQLEELQKPHRLAG